MGGIVVGRDFRFVFLFSLVLIFGEWILAAGEGREMEGSLVCFRWFDRLAASL